MRDFRDRLHLTEVTKERRCEDLVIKVHFRIWRDIQIDMCECFQNVIQDEFRVNDIWEGFKELMNFEPIWIYFN